MLCVCCKETMYSEKRSHYDIFVERTAFLKRGWGGGNVVSFCLHFQEKRKFHMVIDSFSMYITCALQRRRRRRGRFRAVGPVPRMSQKSTTHARYSSMETLVQARAVPVAGCQDLEGGWGTKKKLLESSGYRYLDGLLLKMRGPVSPRSMIPHWGLLTKKL